MHSPVRYYKYKFIVSDNALYVCVVFQDIDTPYARNIIFKFQFSYVGCNMTKSEANRTAAKYMYLSLQNVTVDVYSDKKNQERKKTEKTKQKRKKEKRRKIK